MAVTYTNAEPQCRILYLTCRSLLLLAPVLHDLRLTLCEDVDAGLDSVSDYLREAGAWIEVLTRRPPMAARYNLSSLWFEDEKSKTFSLDHSFIGNPIYSYSMQVNVAVLNLPPPTAKARILQEPSFHWLC